jgi:CheY-like chemotaxis protein
LGDPIRLRQVLTNLVGNAVKFTDSGEVVVTVVVDSVDQGFSMLRFAVRDTGIGIDPGDQERIFHAFEQADTCITRPRAGTGLGLAISRSLVEAMGGRIWIESTPGEGTTVSFTAVFEAAPSLTESGPAAGFDDLADVPILVIDDNATHRSILMEKLRQWGMRSLGAASGVEGLAELESAATHGQPYTLVLLDEAMPGMNGLKVIELIQVNPRLASVAIVLMLSSSDQVASAACCRRLGISTFLVKPIRPAELLENIRTGLGARAVQPDTAQAAPASVGHTLRVLVAEDNVFNQKLSRALVEKMGHEVTLAYNGREALEKWRRGSFDLILMDVQMPEMDGVQATAHIRAVEDRTGGHIPIIAVTAFAMSGDRDRYLNAGMDEYIAKPVSYKRLVQAIGRFFSLDADAAGPQVSTEMAETEGR